NWSRDEKEMIVMDWTPEEFAKAMEAINQKAATDKAFRKLVLDNPREVIQSRLGKELLSTVGEPQGEIINRMVFPFTVFSGKGKGV
ncbi:MAG: hypothetical protein NTX88_00645, partial [Candidatus Atribacteria bacterium]|nr:hypothetical protein [Candidatus Atribacteria bacterium]